jgi:integrase/recombinase XerD
MASASSSLTIPNPPKVSLYLRSGDRYYLPAEARNRKLLPLCGLVDGEPQKFPKGVYCLRYQQNGKRKWERVGKDPQLALIKRGKQEAKLAGLAVGMVDPQAPASLPLTSLLRTSLFAAAAEYIQETRDHKSHKTYLAYQLAVNSFLAEVSEVASLSDVTRAQIMSWMARMKAEGLQARTIHNRVVNLKTLFLHFKMRWPLEKKDRPRYTKKPAKPYTDDELNRLLAHGTIDEVDMVMFFYGCGGREQEVDHGLWTDLCFERGVFYIEEKTEKEDAMEFTTKDREEGEIPLDDVLLERLRKRRARYPKTRLIFPGKDGNPSGHLLRIVKKLALKSGMNCGQCVNRKGQSCEKYPVCRRAILHRFRKNFATMQHHAGADARTIQKWLRHSSLETTLGYLAPSSNDEPVVRERVNRAYSHLVTPTV